MSSSRGSFARLLGVVDEHRRALVKLEIAGPGGRLSVDCGVDTGFTGTLALPSAVVRQLGLRRVGANRATLADGTRILLDRYVAEIEWLSGRRRVHAYATGGGALVGARLLADHRLIIDYPKRTVEIS